MIFENTLLRQVNQATYDADLTEEDFREGVRAVLELLSDPGELDPPGEMAMKRRAWVAGYVQCMRDIVEALADEWGVGEDTYREVSDDHHEGEQ